ncbi:MAG: FAD-dependent oxidoreductase [Parvularcula sp.]|jgi:pyruvate/2-oxoglutarate dehydrogenase complex dihydrolipoamide dehydrogenase (E3) component|nr:FAD-dependent oxidoreductase [Parvularcula sp.]
MMDAMVRDEPATTEPARTLKVDICVIGGGSAGLTAAGGAGLAGRKTVLIEGGKMGGDCLNYGCVPSKALLASAKAAQTVRDAQGFGVGASSPDVDFGGVLARVQRVIGDLAHHDSQERFETEFGVTVLREHARFVGPNAVIAGATRVEAKHFVIATGSSPFVPPIEGLENVPYLTNETVFDERPRPEHLIVLGGGPIGAEMAQAHRRLGCNVTVVEQGQILGKDDPELVEFVRRRLRDEGVVLRERTKAVRVRQEGERVVLSVDGPEGKDEIIGDQLLVAVGRRANTGGVGLGEAGVSTTERGIEVDDRMRTSNKSIYAVGDVTGGLQFTHVAGHQGRLALKNILLAGFGGTIDKDIVPWVTYTEPELAHVGLTETQIKERKLSHDVVRAPYSDNDRANTEDAAEGLLKVYVGKGGRVLGASVVGLHAGEVIQTFAFAVAHKMKISDFDKAILPYPTLGEIAKAAADSYSFERTFTPFNKFALKLLGRFGK